MNDINILFCPLCRQPLELEYFERCNKCDELVCCYCYNPKQKKCAQCEEGLFASAGGENLD